MGEKEKNLISFFFNDCSESCSIKFDCSKSLGCVESDLDEVGGVRKFCGRGRGQVGHGGGGAGGGLS